MDILHPRCAALDVHKKLVTAAVRTHVKGCQYHIETAEFRTYTSDQERQAEWLKQRRVKHVAMESTGVYWKPVWNVLKHRKFQLLLVNPAQVKACRVAKPTGTMPAAVTFSV